MKLKAVGSTLAELLRDVTIYRAEIAKSRGRRPDGAASLHLALEFFSWQRSLSGDRTPVADELPWLTFRAIRHIKRLIRPGARVFEYGAGGSTLFFLRNGATVITVDHDAVWIENVRRMVCKRGYRNWTHFVKPPVDAPAAIDMAPEDPDSYVSSGEEFAGRSFRSYASVIDTFEDESFDLVLVDGRARPSCGKHARFKVKKGGYLVLDNSERELYGAIHADLTDRGWTFRHFYGPGPYNRGFWQTSLYRRPGKLAS